MSERVLHESGCDCYSCRVNDPRWRIESLEADVSGLRRSLRAKSKAHTNAVQRYRELEIEHSSLAARVAELEEKNAKLRAFITLRADPLRRAFGLERNNWTEAIEYDAARAEVENG